MALKKGSSQERCTCLIKVPPPTKEELGGVRSDTSALAPLWGSGEVL
ncbi:MAG: hypothetical protein F7C35_03470 [Desulfurococcales archaeon]|nr:hypothetical protein [Desulfurococcales archaeon]